MKNDQEITIDYITLAKKVQNSLKYGDIKRFMAMHRRYNSHISRQSITNALRGYYRGKNGEQIQRYNLRVLNLLDDFVNAQKREDSQIVNKIVSNS